MRFMKKTNKFNYIVFKTSLWGSSFSQCLLVAVSSVYTDIGFPVCQVLGELLVHTTCFTTFLSCQAKLIFPDLVTRLFHVYPHPRSMLFFSESHPRSSGQYEY